MLGAPFGRSNHQWARVFFASSSSSPPRDVRRLQQHQSPPALQRSLQHESVLHVVVEEEISNALVMEPGGYRFGDYWRVGLPLEIVIAILGTPLIIQFWPL